MADGEAQRFGPFEVLGQLARGGQGAVLRARRLHDGAPAALKLLLRADPKVVRRFRQEAQVLEHLEHPSIVRVLGHGEEQGVPWLAMELVEGQSLRALVDAHGPPPFAFTARTLEALARALAACHSQGVVHRDLKPENVIVEAGTSRAVLVDFGLLARDAEVFGALSLDELSRLSATGELRGTPAFMAPEQAAPARFGAVGPAADVHALGATLHFLLTGAPPFAGGALPALIKKLLDEPAPDPRARTPTVPEGLAVLCQAALAKRPEDRPPSAQAFADALAALLPECLAADAATPRAGVRPPTRESTPPPPHRVPSPGNLLPSRRAASTLRPGSIVGPYEVLAFLGQGGMGTVFRARHRALGTERALKVLTSGGDASRRARFLREVQLLARARHANVVAIHEADTDGVSSWFAMDLVDGEPLDEVLARGRLPLERALRLTVGVARGVEALHALGIVHRDLKPQNVIVVTADDRPVVIDLGLAVDPERDERLTRTGAFVGTVRYMAPEQLSGAATARTDVYALGLIAFELVTGRPALGEAGSVTELTARILTEERPRPGSVDPALGTHLDAVIAAACAREPARRPAHAGAFADLVERAAQDPGPAVAVGRRRRRAAALLVTLGGLVAAGAAVAARPRPAAPVAASAEDAPAPGAPERRDEARDRARELALARREAHEALAQDLAAAERLRRCDAWLARFGALAAHEHADVVAARREARREVPLLARVHREGREARALWTLDGARIVVWGRDHDVIALWDAQGEELRRWELGSHVLALAPGPDRRSLIAGTRRGPWLHRIDLDTGELVSAPPLDPPPEAPIMTLAPSPDGQRLALGDQAGGLRLLETTTGREVARAQAHRSPVRCLAFTPDGRRLVSGAGDWIEGGSADNGLRLWDAATLAPVARAALGAVPYFALFAPDGRRFAVGISAYRLYLFDVEALDREPLELHGRGTEAMTLGLGSPSAHRGAVRAAAFRPDGRLLSIGGERGTVHDSDNELRAWDVDAARELDDSPRSLPAVPLSVAVAPDGRVLVGFQGGAVQVLAPDVLDD